MLAEALFLLNAAFSSRGWCKGPREELGEFSGFSQPGSWEEAAALGQPSLHPRLTVLPPGDALFHSPTN